MSGARCQRADGSPGCGHAPHSPGRCLAEGPHTLRRGRNVGCYCVERPLRAAPAEATPETGLAKMLNDLHHVEELAICRKRHEREPMYCIGPIGHDGRHDFVHDDRTDLREAEQDTRRN